MDSVKYGKLFWFMTNFQQQFNVVSKKALGALHIWRHNFGEKGSSHCDRAGLMYGGLPLVGQFCVTRGRGVVLCEHCLSNLLFSWKVSHGTKEGFRYWFWDFTQNVWICTISPMRLDSVLYSYSSRQFK